MERQHFYPTYELESGAQDRGMTYVINFLRFQLKPDEVKKFGQMWSKVNEVCS